MRKFRGPVWSVVGVLLLAAGFLLRFRATLLFYRQRMRVILLKPQQTLITTGPLASLATRCTSAETASGSLAHHSFKSCPCNQLLIRQSHSKQWLSSFPARRRSGLVVLQLHSLTPRSVSTG
jgi:hypothetical protein